MFLCLSCFELLYKFTHCGTKKMYIKCAGLIITNLQLNNYDNYFPIIMIMESVDYPLFYFHASDLDRYLILYLKSIENEIINLDSR